MKYFGNKNEFVLITGSTGFICKHLVNKLLQSTDFNIVLSYKLNKGNYLPNNRLYFEKANLLNSTSFEPIFAKYKPKIVFHLAAMARVSDGENFPVNVINANLVTTIAITELCIKYKCKSLVFTSSNLAQDAVSVVGITKLLVEQYFQIVNSSNVKLICLRMPNVIDSNGAVTLIFKKLIASNKPITITHPDMSRMFITGEKSAELLFYLAINGTDKGNYVSYDKPIKIIDLANNMITESGKNIDIEIIGMKPGEKLVEKSFSINEIEKTKINGLGRIKEYSYNKELVDRSILKLNNKSGVIENNKIQKILALCCI